MVKLWAEFFSLDAAIQMSIKECSNFTESYTTVSSAVAVFSVYCVFTVGCSANLWPAAQSRPGFYPAQSSSQGGAGADKETVVSCVRHDTSRHYVIMHSGPAIRHRLETKVTCVRPAALAS